MPLPTVARVGRLAGVAQWQSSSLPSWLCGFDSRHPLHSSQLRGLEVGTRPKWKRFRIEPDGLCPERFGLSRGETDSTPSPAPISTSFAVFAKTMTSRELVYTLNAGESRADKSRRY